VGGRGDDVALDRLFAYVSGGSHCPRSRSCEVVAGQDKLDITDMGWWTAVSSANYMFITDRQVFAKALGAETEKHWATMVDGLGALNHPCYVKNVACH
jgi:hypothetical protein